MAPGKGGHRGPLPGAGGVDQKQKGRTHGQNVLVAGDANFIGTLLCRWLPEGYDFEAHRELVPMQPGDAPVTYADTLAL